MLYIFVYVAVLV